MNAGGFGALLSLHRDTAVLVGPFDDADEAARVFDAHVDKFNKRRVTPHPKNFAGAESGERAPHITQFYGVVRDSAAEYHDRPWCAKEVYGPNGERPYNSAKERRLNHSAKPRDAAAVYDSRMDERRMCGRLTGG